MKKCPQCGYKEPEPKPDYLDMSWYPSSPYSHTASCWRDPKPSAYPKEPSPESRNLGYAYQYFLLACWATNDSEHHRYLRSERNQLLICLKDNIGPRNKVEARLKLLERALGIAYATCRRERKLRWREFMHTRMQERIAWLFKNGKAEKAKTLIAKLKTCVRVPSPVEGT